MRKNLNSYSDAITFESFSVCHTRIFKTNGNTVHWNNFRSWEFLYELPICRNDLLDLRDFHYSKWAHVSKNMLYLISEKQHQNSCRLLQYTVERSVACFDVLHQQETTLNHLDASRNKRTFKRSGLHFIFIGDSRIRQQFINFLQVW